MRTSGFTLIELLVVVAIIAILAAILLPIFAQAIHAAKETHCQNNLLQIGRAMEMYRNDWEDFYPVAHNLHNDAYLWEPDQYHRGAAGGYAEPFWWEVLQPYVKNKELFKDPLDKGTGLSFGQGYDSMYDFWKVKLAGAPYNRTNGLSCSYVWNGTLGWKDLWQLTGGKNWRPTSNCNYLTMQKGGPSPKHQGMIQRPAVRYLCWDWIGFWHRTRREGSAGYSAGWTVLFCDTHVKWVGWRDFDEVMALEDPLYAWYVPIESDRAP